MFYQSKSNPQIAPFSENLNRNTNIFNSWDCSECMWILLSCKEDHVHICFPTVLKLSVCILIWLLKFIHWSCDCDKHNVINRPFDHFLCFFKIKTDTATLTFNYAIQIHSFGHHPEARLSIRLYQILVPKLTFLGSVVASPSVESDRWPQLGYNTMGIQTTQHEVALHVTSNALKGSPKINTASQSLRKEFSLWVKKQRRFHSNI